MKKRIIFALLLMGFTSLVVQILLIREFLICFYGNELTIGLILGNWIILEAVGSGLASRFSQKNKKPLLNYGILGCLIALYFPIAVYLTRSVKDFLPLATGEGVGTIPIFISSLFILAPLSLLDGAQFPFGCRIFKDYTQKDIESTGAVYIFEAIGFIIAGPVFTYIFITRLHSFQIAIIIGLLNIFSALLLIEREEKFCLKRAVVAFIYIVFFVGIASYFLNFSSRIDNLSLKKQWKRYTLLESRNSIYGNLALTKEHEQYTFFSDGVPIISSPVPDIITNEEFIHFGMLSHSHPKDILIIGGGAGGPISEILKHPIKHLDYAELDPLLIAMVKKYSSALTQQELTDPRTSIKITDGARYTKTTQNLYDVVFLNLPNPATLQLNRFYTKEFFYAAKKILKEEEGILVFHLPGSLSYLNVPLQKLNLCILDTLKEVFGFVKVIPGDDFNIYIASKNDFHINSAIFIERLKERKIQTSLLTAFHIEYRLHPRWANWFLDTLSKLPAIEKNSSLLPKGLLYGLSYWNSLFSPSLNGFFNLIEKINLKFLITIVIILTLIIFVLSSISTRFKKISVPYAILTTGLAGMTFSLTLILVYQSFYGYVYHHIALLITAFMLGLTLGGWLTTANIYKIKNKKISFIWSEAGWVAFSLAMVPLFICLGKSKLDLSSMFFFLSAVSGFLVGCEFPLANSLYQIKNSTQTAGIIYALDLVGSCIGASIISVVFIPVIGITQTCIFLAILKLSSLILMSILKT